MLGLRTCTGRAWSARAAPTSAPTTPAPAAGKPATPPATPTRSPGSVGAPQSHLIGSAVALVAIIIAATVGIPALVEHRAACLIPDAVPAPPTSSERSYGAQVVLPFTGLHSPSDVAVDSAGNLYVTGYTNNRVVKLVAGSTSQEVLPFTGLTGTWGVAVDSGGTVYVTDPGNNQVLKLPMG